MCLYVCLRVSYVYMWECTHSHSLNSTWHKQQSLCKKGTIFVKRNIHALYHVSSPSTFLFSPREGRVPPVRRVEKGKIQSVRIHSFARGHFCCLLPSFCLNTFFFSFLLFYFCRFLVLSATDLSVGSKGINLVLRETIALTFIFHQDHLCLSSPFCSNILLHLMLVLISQIRKNSSVDLLDE